MEESAASRIPAPVEILIGLAVVTFAAHLAVGGGLELAAALGVTQTLLGVILIGAGTSLPELALSLRAAAEKRASMSVGNVIGSNIFDLLVPMGTAAAIHPLVVERGTLLFDLPCLAILTAALLYLLTHKRGLQRWEAMLLIGIYVSYAGLRITVGLVG